MIKGPAFAALLSVAVIATSGCATKKYVRERVTELDTKTATRSSEIEKNSNDKFENLDTELSRTNEVAKGADTRAGRAMDAANQADQHAAAADQKAQQAGDKATEAQRMAQAASAKAENLTTLKMVSEESVLFKFDSSTLTEEGKATLDQLAKQLENQQRYAIEVYGYADKTGAKNYNLTLSQRRAQAVVRYLSKEHNIPLHSIQLMGYGTDLVPESDDTKPKERNRLSRRVEIRVYTPQAGLEATARPLS